jgi:hypothetical protein
MGCVGGRVGVSAAGGGTSSVVGLFAAVSAWRVSACGVQAGRDAASINPRNPIVTHRSLLMFDDFGGIFIFQDRLLMYL